MPRSSMTRPQMEEKIRKGKSIIISGNGGHIETIDQLPSAAKLAKGDPAATADAVKSLVENISRSMADLKELDPEYDLQTALHPSELDEHDPQRYSSTVPKNGDGEPQTPEESKKDLANEALEAKGGVVKGAGRPIDEQGEVTKGTTGGPVTGTSGPRGAAAADDKAKK